MEDRGGFDCVKLTQQCSDKSALKRSSHSAAQQPQSTLKDLPEHMKDDRHRQGIRVSRNRPRREGGCKKSFTRVHAGPDPASGSCKKRKAAVGLVAGDQPPSARHPGCRLHQTHIRRDYWGRTLLFPIQGQQRLRQVSRPFAG
jgi:hypothetical protein